MVFFYNSHWFISSNSYPFSYFNVCNLLASNYCSLTTSPSLILCSKSFSPIWIYFQSNLSIERMQLFYKIIEAVITSSRNFRLQTLENTLYTSSYSTTYISKFWKQLYAYSGRVQNHNPMSFIWWKANMNSFFKTKVYPWPH